MATEMPTSPRFEQEVILDMANIEELQELDQGSGFFAELVGEFNAQNERLLANIRRDGPICNYESLHFSLHTLKGSSLNVGAMRQGLLALYLEDACKREDCATINEYVPMLSAVAVETAEALRSLL